MGTFVLSLTTAFQCLQAKHGDERSNGRRCVAPVPPVSLS